MTEFDK
jgi:aubergine-like protein